MREAFEHVRFQAKTMLVIEQANAIINEMQAKGYTLTVRQLYYQFVSRDLMANKQQNYQRLASIVDDARKAGFIDWNAIEDRTRFLRKITNYSDPATFIERQANSYYAEDLWANQDTYVEVWIEKDALLGVIERPCNERRVPYFACRGYASSSELYNAGKRFARQARLGKSCVLFHLGDHDPSGLDMTRVNDESVNMFGRIANVRIERLALNMDQVREYDPPPNPAKETDSRYANYEAEYGDESWELDALDPEVIESTIADAIEGVMDRKQFDADMALEEANKKTLLDVAGSFNNVKRYLKYRNEEIDMDGVGVERSAEDVLQQLEDQDEQRS